MDSLDGIEKKIAKERLTFIKATKLLASKLLAENKQAKDSTKTSWEYKVIENNIKQLKQAICNLNSWRTPTGINNYIELRLSLLKDRDSNVVDTIVRPIQENAIAFDIARYSLNYSIIYDMYWNQDGTIGEHTEIALGHQSIETLTKYLPSLIQKLHEKAIPFFRANSIFKTFGILISDIIDKRETIGLQICNISMPPIIEGLVRQFAILVYLRQNPEKNFKQAEDYIAAYQSLEKLITNSKWKDDIPIDLPRAVLRGRYIQDDTLIHAQQFYDSHVQLNHEIQTELKNILDLSKGKWDSNPEEKSCLLTRIQNVINKTQQYTKQIPPDIRVSLNVELQFLLRRYKEDRNNIIHGDIDAFNHEWKFYSNLSAIYGIYKVVSNYFNIYPMKYIQIFERFGVDENFDIIEPVIGQRIRYKKSGFIESQPLDTQSQYTGTAIVLEVDSDQLNVQNLQGDNFKINKVDLLN